MAYISGLSSLVKGQRGEFFFNKDQFLFATNFATNPYFADELNWSKIALYYKDSTSGQRQIIILKDDNGRGWFAPSAMARTGAWSIDRIEVFDKQGDFFVVTRSNMPSPATLDIAVQRIIAPSPSISTIVANAEVIINGTFAANISGWIALAGASWSAGVAAQSIQASAERGFLQQIATVAGQTYEYSIQIASGTAEFYIASGTYNTQADTVAASRLVTRAGVPASTITGQFVASSSAATILVQSSSAGGAITFDNVSLKQVPNIVELAPLASSGLEVGFKLKIWDDVAGAVLTSDLYTIVSIAPQETKDIITLDKQIVGAYAGKTLRLRFPSYSEVSGKQSALFQYVGSGY